MLELRTTWNRAELERVFGLTQGMLAQTMEEYGEKGDDTDSKKWKWRIGFASHEYAQAHQKEFKIGGWTQGAWLYPGSWTPEEIFHVSGSKDGIESYIPGEPR